MAAVLLLVATGMAKAQQPTGIVQTEEYNYVPTEVDYVIELTLQ